MKKVVSALAALTMLLTFTACGETPADNGGDADSTKPAATEPADDGGDETTPADDNGEKQTLNVYAFTVEVPDMVKKYCELHPDFNYEIKETIIPTTDGLYQPALNEALLGGGKDAPDMYAAEAAFVLKYSQGDMAKYAATYEELGIDADAKAKEAEIAQYTIDIGTRDGKIVALGYQATGGAFIYRRSIAKDVWGSDDPATVQDAIGAGSGN